MRALDMLRNFVDWIQLQLQIERNNFGFPNCATEFMKLPNHPKKKLKSRDNFETVLCLK